MLILLRHGRTAANEAGLLQGRLDQDLDDLGREQAADAAERILGEGPVDAVVSSPLKRAHQTAEAFGLDVETDERWIELSYGEYEGVPHADVPSEVWNRWRDDFDFVPEGGEALSTLDRRVRGSLVELAERAESQRIVVVSHVSPMKSAVGWALGTDIGISWRCHLDHASICRIAIRRGHPVLTSFNETV